MARRGPIYLLPIVVLCGLIFAGIKLMGVSKESVLEENVTIELEALGLNVIETDFQSLGINKPKMFRARIVEPQHTYQPSLLLFEMYKAIARAYDRAYFSDELEFVEAEIALPTGKFIQILAPFNMVMDYGHGKITNEQFKESWLGSLDDTIRN